MTPRSNKPRRSAGQKRKGAAGQRETNRERKDEGRGSARREDKKKRGDTQ